MAGVFLGGHLGHLLFYYPEDMADDPAKFAAMFATLASGSLPTVESLPELLKVWRGLSSYGGFIACGTFWVFFTRPSWTCGLTRTAGLRSCAGYMLGRVWLLLSPTHPGIETNFWLGAAADASSTAYGNPAVACHDLGPVEACRSRRCSMSPLSLSRIRV